MAVLSVLSLLESSFRTSDNSSGVSDHQPLGGSRQRRLAVHPVNVVARRDPGDVEAVNRKRRGGGRGEILNIQGFPSNSDGDNAMSTLTTGASVPVAAAATVQSVPVPSWTFSSFPLRSAVLWM